ncbi:MAG: nucleotide-binding domain containing protein [Blastocatellia bacterium]
MLDLRFDRRRQYRAGDGGFDGGAAERFHHRCPRAARPRAHAIQRLSVRWFATDFGIAVYSSASADERAEARRRFEAAGITPDEVATGIESALGEIARRVIEESEIQKLIVAGGETAGAVVDALEIQAVEICETVEAGVPALQTIGNRDLTLVLKSGNFGGSDFFLRALGVSVARP